MLKKCAKCGAVVDVVKDCSCENCGIRCCGEPMQEVKPNSVDAAIEKHLPILEKVGEYIVATVPHVMTPEHYIEYISIVSNKINIKIFFKPGEVAKAVFPYVKGATVSSYCNLHGLWSVEVE